ncbi:hypothetical protein BC938DRAFT_479004 [Jimgerdemannia flammicorona]|uniref:Uncharacterized protein n=1 Tax=Jimgerdemannia flammicorona TaxID=994334 RepID=A0A433QLV3_9FUNG|nr:hypothetical protein BC938DRAFT_479004 [Jimgerdemannia flammicorona]
MLTVDLGLHPIDVDGDRFLDVVALDGAELFLEEHGDIVELAVRYGLGAVAIHTHVVILVGAVGVVVVMVGVLGGWIVQDEICEVGK